MNVGSAHIGVITGCGEKEEKKSKEDATISMPRQDPFPTGRFSLQHVAGKAGDSTGICFVD